MILPLARCSLTSLALRQPFHLTRSISASCFQTASLNGPSVTMCPGSVHLSPQRSTAFLLTARNEWWATCWMNQGSGVPAAPSACTCRAPRCPPCPQRVAVRLGLAAVVGLGALDPEELVRVVRAQLRRDRPQPRVDEVLGGDRLAVRPLAVVPQVEGDGRALESQLWARLGTGLRVFGSSLISGSMMFRSTFDDVVSVASPGSSDGGSAPQAIVIVWFAASAPPPPELLLVPPPQPAATSAATATRRAASAIELRVRIGWCPFLKRPDWAPAEL